MLMPSFETNVVSCCSRRLSGRKVFTIFGRFKRFNTVGGSGVVLKGVRRAVRRGPQEVGPVC